MKKALILCLTFILTIGGFSPSFALPANGQASDLQSVFNYKEAKSKEMRLDSNGTRL